jgi:Fe-S-cluster containining protein
LRAVYQQLEAADEGPAPCLTAEGLRLASSLEADLFLTQFGSTETDSAASCPALQGDRCTAADVRPLVCRNLSSESLLQVQQSLQSRASFSGYPWSRADWLRILADRRAAWLHLTGRISPFDV